MKKVLVVILNYKTYEMTVELINQLNGLDHSLFDICVIDNASPNESADVLSGLSEKLGFIFFKNSINAGYAAGNNIGIRYAIEHGYEYSLILNNDLKIVDSFFIEKLVETADKDSSIACIGPKILDINNQPVPPYCDRPTFYSLTLGIVREKKKRSRYIDTPRKVYRLFGCCMLLRNSAMAAVDCMDERTFLFCEEEILAERLLKEGYAAYYCPDASIVHLESATINKEHAGKNVQKIKIMLKSMELYLREYRRYGVLATKFCQLVRFLVMYIRG